MHYCYHGQLLSTAENTFLTVLLLLETNKLIVKDGFKILKTSQACCTFSFGFFLRRETSFNVKGIYKLRFLFLGMKKKRNSPAFTDKLLVFQQHKTAVRPKEISTYKSGREKVSSCSRQPPFPPNHLTFYSCSAILLFPQFFGLVDFFGFSF